MNQSSSKNIYTGIGLAVLAAFIWSGNFIVARGVYKQIPPISLSFYRWLIATIILLPFAWKNFLKDWRVIKQSWHYLFWVSLSGIALFNTFVYVGGHYTSAINLALIGTTSSPIMANILARVFLKEKIGWYKIIGIILCITGVLFLLSKGDFRNLLHFQFSEGDLWVLLAAFCFAVYNTLVRKKPVAISAPGFLLTIFGIGTFLLLPFFLWELSYTQPVVWSMNLVWVILYLGLGASVICFWIWNIAIHKLGSGRTALFGNLIPIFSSIEAVVWLNEKFTFNHIISMVVVLTGLLIANLPLFFIKRK
jgi:drug/metabolite transporter (DMT)-like permease